MASTTFPNLIINNLTEISFIAGTYQEFNFDIYSESGSPIDITSACCVLGIAPYGQPNYAILVKSGSPVVSGSTVNRFQVILYPEETSSLSGKYIHQPVIASMPNVEYRPSQGLMYVIPQIPTS